MVNDTAKNGLKGGSKMKTIQMLIEDLFKASQKDEVLYQSEFEIGSKSYIGMDPSRF